MITWIIHLPGGKFAILVDEVVKGAPMEEVKAEIKKKFLTNSDIIGVQLMGPQGEVLRYSRSS